MAAGTPILNVEGSNPMAKQARRYSIASCVSAFATALMAYATPATATVSWDFVETSLTYISNGEPVPFFVPGVWGSLSISDSDFLNGGVSYSALNLNYPFFPPIFKIMGDTDFSLSFAGGGPTAVRLPLPLDVDFLDGAINTVNTVAGVFSGSSSFDSISDNFQMTVVNDVTTGTIATDGDTLQCSFSQCKFTGFWELTSSLPVVEPGSFVLLTTALSLIGFLRLRSSGVPPT